MADASKAVCGIVMPISECDGRPPSHWSDVLKIVTEACADAGLSARLVSETYESNLIHKEIIANIYNDDIVVCDVSGRNPNVFFELGIRMATQKPTVIVKDDTTLYPFDTAPNRFIQYPRDLRHPLVELFKKQLSEALSLTLKQPAESSFIGQLGPFQIPKVESKAVPASELILERLDRLERNLSIAAGTSRGSKSEILLKHGVDRWRTTPSSSVTALRENEHTVLFEIVGAESARELDAAFSRVKKLLGPDVEMSIERTGNLIYIVRVQSKSPISDAHIVAIRVALETSLLL